MGKPVLSILLDMTLCGVFTFVVGGFVLLSLIDVDNDISSVHPNFVPNAAMRARAARARKGDGDESDMNAANVAASWPRAFHPIISPSPSPREAAPILYNTRNCECVDDWKDKAGSGERVCT